MKTMTYKGYTAEIIYSNEDRCFIGRIVNIDAIAAFHGDTDDELHEAFENMVDFYIELIQDTDNIPQSKSVWDILNKYEWDILNHQIE